MTEANSPTKSMQTTTQRRDKGRQQYLEELVYNVRVQVGDHVHTPKTGSVDLFQYVSPNPQVKTNEPSNRTVSMTDMVHGYTCANNGNHFSTLFWDDVKFCQYSLQAITPDISISSKACRSFHRAMKRSSINDIR